MINASSIRDTDVLMVGAAPMGVLGLWLTRMGVRVRIFDKTGRRGCAPHARGVHSTRFPQAQEKLLQSVSPVCPELCPALQS
jgi:2-polyprenyl-6-methoxyphenol hydroxylase-like FAD-dependent oxidoreductase